MADQTAQTQRVWEADLTDAGRKLTLDELQALEAMHVCQLLQEISKHLVYCTLALGSVEGRLDRIEQYLMRIDARYPRNGQAEVAGLLLLPAGGGSHGG
jgi:hypothetical protein